MASRTRTKSRNQEIREIWNHLRKVERRESGYCLEQIERNYHLSRDRIYQILAEPHDPAALTAPSAFYSKCLKLEK